MTGSLREAREDGERAASARLTLEERLRHAEKLATIGQMAAEIAHELGTPLNVIGGRARAITKKAGDAGEVSKNAAIIADEVARITKIIHQVLNFSRPRGPTLTRVQLQSVVAEALAFIGETARRFGIAVDLGNAPPPPEVPGDPDQIQQVCLNLITNAIHAMPNGGTLRITTDTVVRRKGGLDLSPPAEYAVLTIADTGPRHPGRRSRQDLRAVLHDQGRGAGDGPGPGRQPRHRQGPRRLDRGRFTSVSGGAVFRVFSPARLRRGWMSHIPPAEGSESQPGVEQAKSMGKD